ncbi:hypothetical protein SNEBB_002374 [Seison nebaliae]|nr:hypothetical protein SNEBB_002374 [Seison nebaliae]
MKNKKVEIERKVIENVFPIATIKRAMIMDRLLVLFIQELIDDSFEVMQQDTKRKTLKGSDVMNAIVRHKKYIFLDSLPLMT